MVAFLEMTPSPLPLQAARYGAEVAVASSSCQRPAPPCSPMPRPSPHTRRLQALRAAGTDCAHDDFALPQARPASVTRHCNSAFVARDYEIVRRLGHGSFGVVDLVRERSTGCDRVCKVVDTRGMDRDGLEQMLQEVRVLRALDHPHIVCLYEYAIDGRRDELVMVLEYVSGGSCQALLDRHRPRHGFDEPLARRLLRQLLGAVAHCHARGVLHRDIKPDHMMLINGSNAAVGGLDASRRMLDCKLIDFGLAASTPASGGDGVYVVERVGTPAYMAPEIVAKSGGFTAKADLWSVGVVALELLTGRPAFAREGRTATYASISRYSSLDTLLIELGERPDRRLLSEGARYFVHRLLQMDAAVRPSAVDALMHAWLSNLESPSSSRAGGNHLPALATPRSGGATPRFKTPTCVCEWSSTMPWAAQVLCDSGDASELPATPELCATSTRPADLRCQPELADVPSAQQDALLDNQRRDGGARRPRVKVAMALSAAGSRALGLLGGA